MKNHSTLSLVILLTFAFCVSCRNDENPVLPIHQSKDFVESLIFTDMRIGLTTTMQFQYANEKIHNILWEVSLEESGFNHSFIERRFYSGNTLDSLITEKGIGEPWHLSYKYKDGLRDKIISRRNGIQLTATFLEYSDTKPTHVTDLYKMYEVKDETYGVPSTSAFRFNESGDLITQKNIGMLEFPGLINEKKTTYSTERNPLQGLIETPLPQIFKFYDDLGFYYSDHLPLTMDADYPFVDPTHNGLTFEYGKDVNGRITVVHALRRYDRSEEYRMEISYRENQ